MSDLSLTVEAFAGCDIKSTCQQLCELAGKLQLTVMCNFNGVKLMALPGGDPNVLEENWHKQISSKLNYKLASTNKQD